MMAFSVPQTGIKDFMNKLLREDTFDQFEVRGVEVNTFTKFEITGALEVEYAEGESGKAPRRFCTWAQLRPYVFNIIKGSIKPKSIKIVFSGDIDLVSNLHANASALHLNMMFNGTEIMFTTATSQKSFSLDKHVDDAWETYITQFFTQKEILILK